MSIKTKLIKTGYLASKNLQIKRKSKPSDFVTDAVSAI
ncbi:hypothetical protein O185_10605 [Photorhabdus temperata J3]|uniref:Uncharacterized protein n=1 Tax=Photorhabdus temperata J3 TaxID=1389415 RepID=U7R350_PHOTE|nr:hypothetical protein O185_10605 [Photorhabdus temperata J3]